MYAVFLFLFSKSLTVYPPNQLHTVPHFILKTMYLQVLLDGSDYWILSADTPVLRFTISSTCARLASVASPILRTTSQPSSFILTTTSVKPFCLQHHFCIGLLLRNIRQCNHFIDRIFSFGLIQRIIVNDCLQGFFLFLERTCSRLSFTFAA